MGVRLDQAALCCFAHKVLCPALRRLGQSLQVNLRSSVCRPPSVFVQPEVEEAVHLVTLAADFQLNDFRAFSAIYNPDDMREC